MYKQIVSLIVLTVFIISLAGCASIMCKGEQSVNIKTTPSGAKVEVYNKDGKMVFSSNTPTIAVLKRGRGYFESERYRVVITKDGYKNREFYISGNANKWYLFGNILLGGLIGYLIVDPISGAMWILSPDDVDINLQDELASLGPQEQGLMIVLRRDVPDNLVPYLKSVEN